MARCTATPLDALAEAHSFNGFTQAGEAVELTPVVRGSLDEFERERQHAFARYGAAGVIATMTHAGKSGLDRVVARAGVPSVRPGAEQHQQALAIPTQDFGCLGVRGATGRDERVEGLLGSCAGGCHPDCLGNV